MLTRAETLFSYSAFLNGFSLVNVVKVCRIFHVFRENINFPHKLSDFILQECIFCRVCRVTLFMKLKKEFILRVTLGVLV